MLGCSCGAKREADREICVVVSIHVEVQVIIFYQYFKLFSSVKGYGLLPRLDSNPAHLQPAIT